MKHPRQDKPQQPSQGSEELSPMASSGASGKPRDKREPSTSSGFEAVERLDMVAAVIKHLRQKILDRQFEPDGILPSEGDLANSFGVSRTVIREAMRSLRAQGLVEVSQGKPPRVKPADSETAIASLGMLLLRSEGSLLQLIEVRRPLESEIAAMAAERAQPEHLAQLQRTIDELRAARTLERRVEADIEFHQVLAEATGNPVFGLLLETLSTLMQVSRRKTIARSGGRRAIQGHQAVLDAVRGHNPSAARQAMLTHLRLAEQDLRENELQTLPARASVHEEH